jgi:hypothetical protein|tara:strand:+ start:9644 stop:9979 length:336 start_codon:yes stop_codon:yes gene_type:complete
MAKVTYTKGQLMAFTVKELRTIDLSVEIGNVSKSELIKGMLKNQKAEQKAQEAKSEIKKDVQPLKVKKELEKNTILTDTVKTKAKEKIISNSSEKIKFHRPKKRRNPMSFK